MKLVTSDVSVVNQKNDLNGIFEHIELIGKTCYKSVVKGGETALEFVKKLISNGHLAMLEHGTCYLFVENYDDSVDDGYLYLRYLNNPYSWVEKLDNNLYITTNYRVIIEHGWERDLGYLCEPSPYHKRRVSAKFICSRAVANEIVRHRIFSYAQESTRQWRH